MTPQQREDLEARIGEQSRTARALFDRHAGAQLSARPASGGWSAVECLTHLSLTSAAMVPLIETAIADLRSRGARSAAPSRMDWKGRLLRWVLEPRRFRSKTTPSFEPQATVDPTEALAEFLRWQDRTVVALRSAEGWDLTAARVVSPFDSRMSYNAFAAFRILETHERRHLDQAARALSHHS